jgi:hypothetical protein
VIDLLDRIFFFLLSLFQKTKSEEKPEILPDSKEEEDMEEDEFETFYQIIREKESDPNTPFIRTRFKPKGGSTAYGPLQTTGQRVDTMISALGDSLTSDELSALSLLRDRQRLAAFYGGDDRKKYEDPDSPNYKPKEFLDMMDYGGNLGITDSDTQRLIESAQKKELLRHYKNHGGDFARAAAAWHGGDNWESGKDTPKKRRTANYGRDAVRRLKKRREALRLSSDSDGRKFF